MEVHEVLAANASCPADGTPADSLCPSSFNCSSRNGTASIGIGAIPTYLSIVSCSMSCLGSVLIFVVYCTLKEVRNGAQKIITLLALADFMQAFGYLIGAWNYLTHYNLADQHRCKDVFHTVCQVQSFITSWASLSSFNWTFALALHFFLVLSPTRRLWTKKWWLLPLQNIFGWALPLAIFLPLLATGKLGYAPYAAANWCFVKSDASDKFQYLEIVIVLIAGKFWEILTYVVVIITYFITRRQFQKQLAAYDDEHRPINAQQQDDYVKEVRKEVNNRLLLIPIVFLLLRIWGTVQFFFSIGVADQNVCGCIPNTIHKVFFGLGILQAIGDGGQGWGNAILYIFISSSIRRQLFFDPCAKLVRLTGKKFRQFGSKLETVGASDHDIVDDHHEHFENSIQNKNRNRHRSVYRGRTATVSSAAATADLDIAGPAPIDDSLTASQTIAEV